MLSGGGPYESRSVPARFSSSKEFAEECCRAIRDANNFVRRLTIEFEIELRLRSTVIPIGKGFQLAPPQASLRDGGAPDSDAHTRSQPSDPALLWDGFGRCDDAAHNQSRPAFILARKDEDRIAFGYELAPIHRLLRVERERLGLGDAN